MGNEEINRILAICTGVENLVILVATWNLNFFENPQAGRNLRRLATRLGNFSPLQYRSTQPNFNHPCFANLTHLHLTDDDGDWPDYKGWEKLTKLTHLAFACAYSPRQTNKILKMLPTVRYVALGFYRGGKQYEYAYATVDPNISSYIAAWDVRVVVLLELSLRDWERGARGMGDFWDLVEREVERRLEGRLDGSEG